MRKGSFFHKFLVHTLHVVLCHPHVMMHTIRSTCPLSLSLSLSESFLVYFRAHLPLPTRPTRIALIRSNQVAPTQRGDLDSIVSTCHRGGADVLSALNAGLFYSNGNNEWPQSSAFTSKGILLSWGWVSRSPKANRRPLYWDPPHRPEARLSLTIIPEPGGHTISDPRRHLERSRGTAMRARGDPCVTPHWSVPGIAQRRATHNTPTPMDTLFQRLTVRKTCQSFQVEGNEGQSDGTIIIIIIVIIITITTTGPPGTTCPKSPDPNTLTPLACPPELSLFPSPGTKRLSFLSHHVWLDRGRQRAERRVPPPPPHPRRCPHPPAAPPGDQGGPAQHLLKRISTCAHTSAQCLDR